MQKDSFRKACIEYNPDEDVRTTGGRLGMALAECMYNMFNGDTKKICRWFEGRASRKNLGRNLGEYSSQRKNRFPHNPQELLYERYIHFIQNAEKIKPWETIKMGRLLEKSFPDVYSPFGKKPLKGKRLSEVRNEFQRKKSYVKRKLKSEKIQLFKTFNFS